jgi:hypothetical protein
MATVYSDGPVEVDGGGDRTFHMSEVSARV